MAGRLWQIIEQFKDAQTGFVSDAWIAKHLGLSGRTSLTSWKLVGTVLPSKSALRAVSTLTGAPYLAVLNAALLDSGYLLETDGSGETMRRYPLPPSRAR